MGEEQHRDGWPQLRGVVARWQPRRSGTSQEPCAHPWCWPWSTRVALGLRGRPGNESGRGYPEGRRHHKRSQPSRLARHKRFARTAGRNGTANKNSLRIRERSKEQTTRSCVGEVNARSGVCVHPPPFACRCWGSLKFNLKRMYY